MSNPTLDVPSQPEQTAAYMSLRARVIQAVHSPLGFFVLALLIVESFLLGAGIWFDISGEWRLVAMGVGVLLFLIVFATVVWLVVKHPQNLVFSEESHVQYAAMRMFGSESNTFTAHALEGMPQIPTPDPPIGQLPSGGGEDIA